jgi:hypothetical protein
VKEAFTELQVPLLKDVSFAKDLQASIAAVGRTIPDPVRRGMEVWPVMGDQ